MVVVLALAFVMSAVVTIYLLFRIGDTRVPNLVGKPEVEAQKTAEKAGFKVKLQRRNDPAVPANTVIETRPIPNSSVKKDSFLTIVVSSGPAQLKSEAGGLDVPPPVFSGARRGAASVARGLSAPGPAI
jgi:beta-lactam-binding protein with PASTA domain